MLAALALYAGLLLLELDWNLRSWQPTLDGLAIGLLVGLPALLAVFWFLAQSTTGRVTRWFSLLICVGLALLAIYTTTAEAMTGGMFAREVASPFWYRGGRLVALCLPGFFWIAVGGGRRGKPKVHRALA